MLFEKHTRTLTPANVIHAADEAAATLPGLMMEAERVMHDLSGGDHNLRKAGSGERFWQFREYDPADRPQDIDWRQSAKTDSVYVRQKEHQNAQSIYFWCDTGAAMDFTSSKEVPKKITAARVMSVALAMLCTRAHEKTGLISGDFQAGRTEKTIERIARNLLFEGETSFNDFHFLDLPKNAQAVLISDFLQPIEDTEKVAKALSAQVGGGVMIQVLDPAEISLPYNGRVLFETPDGRDKELIDHVPSINARYEDRIRRHNETLQTLCRDLGWTYLLHRTDHDLRESLSTLWMALTPEKAGS